jgi:hypothetical protein
MADTVTNPRTTNHPESGALAALHEAAAAVRLAWERLDAEPADARRYITALWQVQSAEENYLRLRERLLGA